MAKKKKIAGKKKNLEETMIKGDHTTLDDLNQQLTVMQDSLGSLEGVASFLDAQLLGNSEEVEVTQEDYSEDSSALDDLSVMIGNIQERLNSITGRFLVSTETLNMADCTLSKFLPKMTKEAASEEDYEDEE